MSAVQDRELLGPSQAGRLLGVSAVRVKQLADEGKLPSQRTGIGRVFDSGDVIKLARERAANNRRQDVGE